MPGTERIFILQSYGDEFYTGSTDDGTQVLMGLLCPYVVTYFFNAEGVLVNARRQLWKHPAPRMGDDGPYQIYDGQFMQAIGQQIQEWQKEIGFQENPIHIQKFGDEEMFVGITEVPEDLEEATENDPEDEELAQELADWKENYDFVFYWAKDYWVSASGEVEST